MNAASLTSAFTAPADFRLESCSPESGLSELDGALELDGLELGPELQFLLESHMSQSPTHSDSHLLDSLDKGMSPCTPDGARMCGRSASCSQPSGPKNVINITATSAVHHGPPTISLSACSTDSRAELVSTTDSRSGGPHRVGRPPRRAAAAAALEHHHIVHGSPGASGGGHHRAASTPITQARNEDIDMDLSLDDLLDSDCEKRSGQKRPRRRVIVETKDASGRPYTAAEIRRMKRRITNRESARRMRLKRQEEWGIIKRQARAMREEVQKMGGKVAALQAHCGTLEGEAERWQALWRQAAASNAQLTQRLNALQLGDRGRTSDGYESTLTSAEPAMSADDLLSPDPLHSKSLQGMGRAHSAAPPAFGGVPSDVSAAARRAASVPEPVSGPLRTSSLPTVAGALAALEEEARRFEDRFEDDAAFASLFDGF
ncbi:g8504 [Coccomyxa elongata]